MGLFYRRPAFVPHPSGPTKDEDDGNSSRPTSITGGIPDEISFDKVIRGVTRSPCTLQDFMDYCQFIEYSAENLQFYLWLQNYSRRFEEAPQFERDLSPRWTAEDQTMALRRARAETRMDARRDTGMGLGKGPETPSIREISVGSTCTDSRFEVSSARSVAEESNPFDTPPMTPRSPGLSWNTPLRSESTKSSLHGFSTAAIAGESFSNAGLSKPFTIQPFREEIDQIIAMYLAEDSPRELNLAGPERTALLVALQKTTHPSAFSYAQMVVLRTLRGQSHPNFVRWAICNCNTQRRTFCQGLAVSLMLFGILLSLLLTLSNVSRGWRAFGAFFVLPGAAFLVTATKGVCPIIYGFHRRQLRPWETPIRDDRELAVSSSSILSEKDWSWAGLYNDRNVLTKIFDREVWVQEKAMRRIHDQISLQAIVLATPVAMVFLIVFLAVPSGGFF